MPGSGFFSFPIYKIMKNSVLPAALATAMLVIQCSKTEAPELPAAIEILSGDDQYYMHGSQLPAPLVVSALQTNGSPSVDALIRFSITQGGGLVSASSVRTNSSGSAAVNMTLGQANGLNSVKAALDIDPDKFVVFNATSSDYFCREADPTPVVSFGTRGDLFLATFKSAIYSSSSTNAGIVRIAPFFHDVSGFKEYPTDTYITTVWDLAFSPRGDLYLSKSGALDEIDKISPGGTSERFASLDDPDGAELTSYPPGLIAGCDKKGPFLIGCEGELTRFTGALYPARTINNDALAVNQVTEDIYFISTEASALLHLPIDNFSASGPVDTVAQLTAEEADSASGMVWSDNGSIYIIVDTNNTKECIQVDALGIKTTVFDFFSRGPGALAGKQVDLAIDRSLGIIYTLDTRNNALLAFDTNAPQNGFAPLFSSEDLSTTGYFGERVGLAVIP